MNKFLLITLFMCVSFLGTAQNQVDIVNEKGQVVMTVNAKYCEFYHAFAVTMEETGGTEKYGVIDLKSLKHTVPPNADYGLIEWYNHDAFGKVHTDKGVGLIDFGNGTFVIPPGEHTISDKKGNHIMVRTSYQGADGRYNTRTSIYNLKGKKVYTGDGRIEMTDSDTFFKEHDGSISGPYAIDGSKLPTHANYEGVEYIYFSNGYTTLEKDGKEALLDETGKLILPFEFDDISPGSKGWILAEKDDQAVIMNKEGKAVSPYMPASDYSYMILDHFLVYRTDAGSGMMDFKGNKLTEPRFKEVEGVGKLLYYVDKDGAPGIVSAEGEDLINLGDGIEIVRKTETAFSAKMDGKTGLLTIDGEELVPFDYETVTLLDGDYWGVSDRAGNHGIYDAKQRSWVYNMNLSSLKSYYGMITFEKGGYMGAIVGSVHVPPTKYKNILGGGDGYISAVR